MKRFLAMALVLSFVLGLVFSAYAGNISGTITKMEGSKITLKQADGKEVTVELKVGDKITIKQETPKGKEASPAPKKKKAVEGC